MTRWHCDAPAKINLALHVTGRNAGGYHLLETLAAFTQAGDRITVRPCDISNGPGRLAASGPFAGAMGAEADNLAIAALEALTDAAGQVAGQRGRVEARLCLELQKNLPVASGIGGGSADAAATLLAACAALGLPEDFDLDTIALGLGADVPMCLRSCPLIARGIGEAIEPVTGLPQLHLLLVNPGTAVSTRDVFAALATTSNPPLPPLPGFGTGEDLAAWLRQTRNDLEPAARKIAPSIGLVLDAISGEPGCLFSRMSGSGATCFGIFPDAKACENAAQALSRREPGWWVAATRTQDAPAQPRKRPWQE